MSLKQKTVSGLAWSSVDNLSKNGIVFIVGIILARLLTPEEFGLIGMIAIFIAISTSIIDSGFGAALIRKKDCSEKDYSTVFYFNMGVAIVIYCVLFFSAPMISRFFNEPELIRLIQVLSISLLIGSLSVIHTTILTKGMNFKLQTKVSVIASITSGALAIVLAFRGFGVWSLVVRQLCHRTVYTFLLWFWHRWRPVLVFSLQSFRELFSFGSKLLVSGLIDTIYNNIYYLIIGKFFSAAELGYFTRANVFKNLPSENLSSVINRVSYPALTNFQDDIPGLKENYQKLIRSTMLITFVLMIGMAVVAEPMIIVLLGEKWLPSVEYLQLLCFVGMFYPLQNMNLNMLKVQGRSDLILKLQVIRKVLAIPIIFIGIFLGIKAMIIGMMVEAIIGYYLNSYWSGKRIGYSMLEQVKDIFPSFLLAISVGIIVFGIAYVFPLEAIWTLLLQIVVGGILTISFCEIVKFRDYIFIKNLIVGKMKPT